MEDRRLKIDSKGRIALPREVVEELVERNRRAAVLKMLHRDIFLTPTDEALTRYFLYAYDCVKRLERTMDCEMLDLFHYSTSQRQIDSRGRIQVLRSYESGFLRIYREGEVFVLEREQ